MMVRVRYVVAVLVTVLHTLASYGSKMSRINLHGSGADAFPSTIAHASAFRRDFTRAAQHNAVFSTDNILTAIDRASAGRSRLLAARAVVSLSTDWSMFRRPSSRRASRTAVVVCTKDGIGGLDDRIARSGEGDGTDSGGLDVFGDGGESIGAVEMSTKRMQGRFRQTDSRFHSRFLLFPVASAEAEESKAKAASLARVGEKRIVERTELKKEKSEERK